MKYCNQHILFMKAKINAYIQHTLDAIKSIEDFTEGVTLEEFTKNKEKHSATIRQFEIIGEAINSLEKILEKEGKTLKDASVPIESIVEMRNILIHEYFAVDLKLVWEAVHEDLPNLRKQIVSLQNSLEL